jgi:WD40 repeat protein
MSPFLTGTASASFSASSPTYVMLEGHTDKVTSVAWPPVSLGGIFLASGSHDGTSRVWDLSRLLDVVSSASASPPTSVIHEEDMGYMVNSVAWSPDGAFLTSGMSGVRVSKMFTLEEAGALLEREIPGVDGSLTKDMALKIGLPSDILSLL